MSPAELIQVISAGINIALLIILIKLVRFLSRIELKVDTMWVDFMRRRAGIKEGE